MIYTQISSKRQLSRTIRTMIAAVVLVPMIALQTSAQQNDSGSVSTLIHSAKFEVVSIHPDDPDGHQTRIEMTPNGRFVANGITIKRLVCMAYGIQDFQLVGGPAWISSERFAIQAKTEGQVEQELPKLSDDERLLVGKQMVQAMLADRLNLKMRPESKEMSTLGMVVAKNGANLHEAKPGDEYPNGLKEGDGKGHAGMMRFNGHQLTAQGVKLDNLATFLSEQLHQIVQNKSGLDGKYDFKLEWSQETDHPMGPGQTSGEAGNALADENSSPSIFTAIQEQLGLRLEPQKSAVAVYLVETIERPTEN